MQKILTAEEMREVDRLTTALYKIPSIILMENAAHAAARAILERFGGDVSGRRFLILCGKGNNGGDGAALARVLWTLGASCFVDLVGKIDDTAGDARANFEILRRIEEDPESNGPNENCLYMRESKAEWLPHAVVDAEYDAIIDALFGTGLSRPVTGDLGEAIALISVKKGSGRLPLLVALDLPSGFDSNSPQPIGPHLTADLTVTFTAPKLANVLPPASSANGELVVAKIGSPDVLIENFASTNFVAEASDAREWLRKTRFDDASYKNKRGHALLVAGSREYAGAAVLAANSAIVSGVGLVTLASPDSAIDLIAQRLLPEVILRGVDDADGVLTAASIEEITKVSADAMLVGSGLTRSERTSKLVRALVENRRTPLILDADALNALAPFELQGSDELPVVLTPHEGEFKRLCAVAEMPGDRINSAREFASKHNVILVLKGERVLIAHPDGRVVVNPTGNSGLGKAGNGDTLAGLIAGFAAQAARMKIDIFETVVAAVYIAGVAGDIAEAKFGKRTMLASDVRESIAEAFEVLGE